MAEWSPLRWTIEQDVFLQCPNCGVVLFVPQSQLTQLYADALAVGARPHMKCECDFRPYLPLELKRISYLPVVLKATDDRTVWSPVDAPMDEVRVSTYGIPSAVEKKLKTGLSDATRSQVE